jgi:uncharacterized protein
MNILNNREIIIKKTLNGLIEILKKSEVIAAHGYDHMIRVWEHSIQALKHENYLTELQKLEVEISSIKHDEDDKKLFPNGDGQNAKKSLIISCDSVVNEDSEFILHILQMIDLVSCSKNDSSVVNYPKYYYIPRDCDRLDAMGKIGIIRFRDFILQKKAPFHIDSTIRVYSEEELIYLIYNSKQRFVDYCNGKRSVSMIDNFYDKLLHIGQAENLQSKNPYILKTAESFQKELINFVVGYWKALENGKSLEYILNYC